MTEYDAAVRKSAHDGVYDNLDSVILLPCDVRDPKTVSQWRQVYLNRRRPDGGSKVLIEKYHHRRKAYRYRSGQEPGVQRLSQYRESAVMNCWCGQIVVAYYLYCCGRSMQIASNRQQSLASS